MAKFKYEHWIFKLWFMKGFDAITLGTTILFRHREDAVSRSLVAHELVHVAQISQYGALRFYLIYVLDYLRNRLQYKSHYRAYLQIPFEIEARSESRLGERHG